MRWLIEKIQELKWCIKNEIKTFYTMWTSNNLRCMWIGFKKTFEADLNEISEPT